MSYNHILTCELEKSKVGPIEKFHAEGTVLKSHSKLYITDTSNLVVEGNIAAYKLITSKFPATYSDITLKKNVRNIDKSLDILNNLLPRKYEYHSDNSTSHGFIAQEVENILPSLVSTDSNGLKFVNYIELIPILCQTIKDLNKKIDDLYTLTMKNA